MFPSDSVSATAAMKRRPSLRAMLKGLAVLASAALVFWACVQPEPRWWTLLPMLAPLALWAGAVLGARMAGRAGAILLAVGMLAVLAGGLAWLVPAGHDGLVQPQQVRFYYFLQETLLLGLVFWAFAHTLRAGQTPLCTTMAGVVHPVLTPVLLRYTRGVTWLWAGAIALIWLVSAVLFVFATPAVWAFFSSVLSPLLMVALFVLEVLARRWLLPPDEQTGLAQTLRAMRTVDWRSFSGAAHSRVDDKGMEPLR